MIWLFLYIVCDDIKALVEGRPRARLSHLLIFTAAWFLFLPWLLHALVTGFFSAFLGTAGWWLALILVLWLYAVNPMKFVNWLRSSWFVPRFLRPKVRTDVPVDDEIQLVVLLRKEAAAIAGTKPTRHISAGEDLPVGWVCFRKDRYEGAFATKRGNYQGFVKRVGNELVPHIQNPPEVLRKHSSHGACFRATDEAMVYRIHLIGRRPSTVMDCIYGTNSILERLGA